MIGHRSKRFPRNPEVTFYVDIILHDEFKTLGGRSSHYLPTPSVKLPSAAAILLFNLSHNAPFKTKPRGV